MATQNELRIPATRYGGCVIGLLFIVPQIGMAQTTPRLIPIDSLQKSPYCLTRLPQIMAGNDGDLGNQNLPRAHQQPSTLTMRNDGWCWFDLTATLHGQPIAPTVKVIDQPAHGQIIIEPSPVKNKTRIAYKAEPEFTGTDNFTLQDVETSIRRRMEVSVMPR